MEMGTLGKLDIRLPVKPDLSSCMKVKSKWMKDFGARPENLKLLKKVCIKCFELQAQAKLSGKNLKEEQLSEK